MHHYITNYSITKQASAMNNVNEFGVSASKELVWELE